MLLALSIKQPWAWLVVMGYKDVENSKHKTDYRGPLLIYASNDWDTKELDSANRLIKPIILTDNTKHYKFGAIIGMVELYDCVEDYRSKWYKGPYGFLFRKPKQFIKPIPYEEQSGLFNVKSDIIHKYLQEDNK
jgi:hypothetical protein